MAEWREVSLTDLYDVGSGLSKPASAFGCGFGFLSFRDVFRNYFVPENLSELVQSTEKEQMTCSIQRGDVFLTRTSETQDELGMSCVALKAYPRATFNGFTKRLRLKQAGTVVPEYAAYYFRSPKFRTAVSAMSSLSTRASLNNEMISRLKITLPSLAEQLAIGHILKRLDDKIELNRKMNETLEAMARALFKSWFVDFDPVRKKQAGQATGLPAEIDVLFPNEFEDSALGEIPKGWRVAPLRDLTSYLSRGLSPTYIEEGGTLVLNQKCIRDHRVDFTKGRRHDSTKRSTEGRLLQVLDILINSTGVGTLGRVAQLWALPQEAVVDSHVTVVRAAEAIDPWFLGATLLGREQEIEGLGEGSTGQTELSRVRLGELPCVIAPLSTQLAFGKHVGSLCRKIASNSQQNDDLAITRDTLLPKLISGELRVRDAERFVGGVV